MSSRCCAVALVSLLLVAGAGGCSDDDAPPAGAATRSSDAGDVADALSGLPDTGRPFGANLAGLASALETATGATDYEVDGDTIQLRYDEGSTDSPMASVNCSVADTIKSPDDRIVLVYPDGTVDCTDLMEDNS